MDQMITQWPAHCVGKGERHWKTWKGCYSHLWDATGHTGSPPAPQDSEARTQVQALYLGPKTYEGCGNEPGKGRWQKSWVIKPATKVGHWNLTGKSYTRHPV